MAGGQPSGPGGDRPGKGLKRAAAPRDRLDPLASTLLDHLRREVGRARRERLHVLYGDAEGRCVFDEMLAAGDASGIRTRARPLFARALSLGARGLVLAHNHPGGDCRPSEEDVAATTRLDALAAALDLTLYDHLIFAADRVFSMRKGSLL